MNHVQKHNKVSEGKASKVTHQVVMIWSYNTMNNQSPHLFQARIASMINSAKSKQSLGHSETFRGATFLVSESLAVSPASNRTNHTTWSSPRSEPPSSSVMPQKASKVVGRSLGSGAVSLKKSHAIGIHWIHEGQSNN